MVQKYGIKTETILRLLYLNMVSQYEYAKEKLLALEHNTCCSLKARLGPFFAFAMSDNLCPCRWFCGVLCHGLHD